MGPLRVTLSQLLLVLLTPICASFQSQVVQQASDLEPFSNETSSCRGSVGCKPGILLPVWLPLKPSPWDQAGRAVVYFVSLMYLFLGVSIIADRFMASIEVITSQEKEVTITKPGGLTTITTVRVWNETVSNLTLMALGSSAPEILLSVIEVCGHGFNAGELGPGTIVGSAAFNMFVIIGLCVLIIPEGEHRRIKHLRVYFVTSFWSIFAYIWLYLILAVISPGIVEVWEAVVTLVYFPLFVILAWIADCHRLFFKCLHKGYRADTSIVDAMEGDQEPTGIDVVMGERLPDGSWFLGTSCSETMSGREVEPSRDEVICILKDLKAKHPDKDLDQLMDMANYSALVLQKKSRAFYRVQVTRMMTGGGNILQKYVVEHSHHTGHKDDLATCSRICFERAQYQCTENCGALCLGVALKGGTGQNTFFVDYCTENGSASAGADYIFNKGTLVFGPGETRQEIKVDILDDDIFEEDGQFFVRLQNLRQEGCEGAGSPPKGRLVEPLVASITILDDDHAGVFIFGQQVLRMNMGTGTLTVTVVRNCGSRGPVAVPFHTQDGSAKAGVDYQESKGLLQFADKQTSQTLKVQILNVEQCEIRKSFFIVLEDPAWQQEGISGSSSLTEEEAEKVCEMGKPILGQHSRLEVMVGESSELKNTVVKFKRDTNLALVIATHSWREQFMEAVTVNAGAEDGEGQVQPIPNCFDYFMHILCLFWKILFACIPPTEYWNGWACFIVSVVGIGFLTAIIGDVASHFGCTVGLRDTVTAVVFVALGTSLPDTFASKFAATQDQYADACVGNVTGSNAVNVFLGIGLAWSVAAVYWKIKGGVFHVDPGSLAFSVTLFTIFAFLSMGVLMLRRRSAIGSELGGPRIPKVLTSMLFFGLWFLYILLSSLEVYCHIRGF
uniref:Na+/Ca2+ exchanger n=1 Tax=Takifugu obscurus TaxID=309541 RepID=G9MAJ9_TAKOB|nr:Na+/Ca2+ exchanger [Takifugu obscurus]